MKEENSKEIENQTSKDYWDVSKSQICGGTSHKIINLDTSFMIENKEIKAKPKITKFMGYLFGFNKSINTFTQISAQKIIGNLNKELFLIYYR